VRGAQLVGTHVPIAACVTIRLRTAVDCDPPPFACGSTKLVVAGLDAVSLSLGPFLEVFWGNFLFFCGFRGFPCCFRATEFVSVFRGFRGPRNKRMPIWVWLVISAASSALVISCWFLSNHFTLFVMHITRGSVSTLLWAPPAVQALETCTL
jgi:hypothetical protein